jgi:hypothetical protein
MSKVEQIMRAALPDWEFDRFVSYKTVATVGNISKADRTEVRAWTSGPWSGFIASNPYVTAIKVNARTAQHVPSGPLVKGSQQAFRRVGYPELEKLGYEVAHLEIRPWGSAPYKAPDSPEPVDKGLPVTPALPSPEQTLVVAEKSNALMWWLLLGTAAATAYAYSRKTP